MVRIILLCVLLVLGPAVNAEEEVASGTLDAIYWEQQALVIGDIYYRIGVNAVFHDKEGKPMARSELRLGDVLQYQAREYMKRLEVTYVKRIKEFGQ